MSTRKANEPEALTRTRTWLERAVIGLELCPFAKAVHNKGRIRWVLSTARDAIALRDDVRHELCLLAATPIEQIETTLLLHPQALTDFLDYNDFLDVADAQIADLGLTGTIQIASFHPEYVFAGSAAEDIENASNRSPVPMLHLLREASIDRAVAAYPDPAAIVERNRVTLRRLGVVGWRALAAAWQADQQVST